MCTKFSKTAIKKSNKRKRKREMTHSAEELNSSRHPPRICCRDYRSRLWRCCRQTVALLSQCTPGVNQIYTATSSALTCASELLLHCSVPAHYQQPVFRGAAQRRNFVITVRCWDYVLQTEPTLKDHDVKLKVNNVVLYFKRRGRQADTCPGTLSAVNGELLYVLDANRRFLHVETREKAID